MMSHAFSTYPSSFRVDETDRVEPIRAIRTIRELTNLYYKPYERSIQHGSFMDFSVHDTIPIADYNYIFQRLVALRAVATRHCARAVHADKSYYATLLHARNLLAYTLRTRASIKANAACFRCHRSVRCCRCVAHHRPLPPKASQRLKNCVAADRHQHLRHRCSKLSEHLFDPGRLQGVTLLTALLTQIDYVLGVWFLVFTRTPFWRNIGKRVIFLDHCTGFGGIGTTPELSPDSVYLYFSPGTRKLYVGQTGTPLPVRSLAHMSGSVAGNTPFYARNRENWHQFLCIAVLKPSFIRSDSTYCRTTIPEREALEGLVMGLLNPSENTLGVTGFHLGLIRSFILRPGPERDVRKRQLAPRGPFIGAAYIDRRRATFIVAENWLDSYKKVLTSFKQGDQIDIARRAVSTLSQKVDDIPQDIARELRMKGPEFGNRVLKSQRFMSMTRYAMLRANLRTLYGPEAGKLRDPCGTRVFRWPWISTHGGILDDLIKLLQATYRRIAAEYQLYLDEDSSCYRANVRALPARSANDRWKTTLKEHRAWFPPSRCRCRELLQKYGHLGVDTVLVDNQPHICTRLSGPLAFRDPSKPCSSKTKLRPDAGVQKRAFAKEITRLFDRIGFRLAPMDLAAIRIVAYVADETDRTSLPMPTFSEIWNTGVLDDFCKGNYCDVIDKPTSLATLTVECREVYMSKARAFLANGSYCRMRGFNSIKMNDPHRKFWRLKDRLQGGAHVATRHKIATLRLPNKEKGLRAPGVPCTNAIDLKPRPVAAYLEHRYKIPLQLASKALGLLSRIAHPGRTYKSTAQWVQVVDAANRRTLEDRRGTIFTAQTDADIGGFFNMIDPNAGIEEIKDALEEQRLQHGTTWFGFKRGLRTWVGKHGQCNSIRQLKDTDIVMTRRRPDQKLYTTLSFNDVVLLCEMDVRYGFQSCIGTVSKQIWGTPMGSPLGDRLSTFNAHRKEKEFPAVEGKARFVDDKGSTWNGTVPTQLQVQAAGGDFVDAFVHHPTNLALRDDEEMSADFYDGLELKPSDQNVFAAAHTDTQYLGCTAQNVIVDATGALVAELANHERGTRPDPTLCRMIVEHPTTYRKILRVRQKPLCAGTLSSPLAYRTRRQSTMLVVSALHRAHRSASELPLGNKDREVLHTYRWYEQQGYPVSFRRKRKLQDAYELFYHCRLPREPD